MSHTKTLCLSAAFVLAVAVNASAATRHHHVIYSYGAQSYDTVPVQSNACPPVPPCAPQRNDW